MSRGLRYRVIRKLAHGGMAEIFLAMQVGAEGFEKPVVLKRILPALAADPGFVRMLVDEAHIASRLSHSHIVQVLDLGKAADQFFLALEFVDGFSLEQIRLRARKARLKLPLPLALYVVSALCRGLDYAHRRTRNGKPLGIVHRDVTPQNVLIGREGDVKLADFGIAKARGRRERSATGVIKGKFAYMSPEQSIGAALDARSDLFSVGTLLYVLTTGKKPFEGTTDLDVLMQVRKARYEKPSNLIKDFNPDVERFIARALRADPAKRFQSAEQMADRLDAILFKLGQPTGPAALKRWLETLCARDGVRPPGDARDFSASSGETLELASHELELQVVAMPPDDGDDDELSVAEAVPETWRRAVAGEPLPLPPKADTEADADAQAEARPGPLGLEGEHDSALAYVVPGETAYTCVGTAPTQLSRSSDGLALAALDGPAREPGASLALERPLGAIAPLSAGAFGPTLGALADEDELDDALTRRVARSDPAPEPATESGASSDDDELDLALSEASEPELDAALAAALDAYERPQRPRPAPERTSVEVLTTRVVGEPRPTRRAEAAPAPDHDAHEAPTRVAHADAAWLGLRTAPHAQLDVTPQLGAAGSWSASDTPTHALPELAQPKLRPAKEAKDPTLVLPAIPARTPYAAQAASEGDAATLPRPATRIGGHAPAPVYSHAALRSTLEALPRDPTPASLAFAGAGMGSATGLALDPARSLRLRLGDDDDDTEIDARALPVSTPVRALRALRAALGAAAVCALLSAIGLVLARPYFPLWAVRSEPVVELDAALARVAPLRALIESALSR